MNTLVAVRIPRQLRCGYATCLLALVAITFPHWFHGPQAAMLATGLMVGLGVQLSAVWPAVRAELSQSGVQVADSSPRTHSDNDNPDLLLVSMSLVLANVAVVVVFSS